MDIWNWISVKDGGIPNFCMFGFHTGHKVMFRAGDGDHTGIYQGYGGFSTNESGEFVSYDVGFEDERKVTDWKPLMPEHHHLEGASPS